MAQSYLPIVILAVVCSIANLEAASLREKRQAIPREFQNIRIEDYLKNPRAVQFQLKCVIYNGPCDRIGKYLKVTIPELLTNQCRNCNPAQRKQAGRLVAFIQQNYPKEWDDAVKKYQGGRVVSASEAKRFENEFGIKLSGVSTESPTAEEEANTGPSTPSTTTARVTLEEVGQIAREAQKELAKQQQQQRN